MKKGLLILATLLFVSAGTLSASTQAPAKECKKTECTQKKDCPKECPKECAKKDSCTKKADCSKKKDCPKK